MQKQKVPSAYQVCTKYASSTHQVHIWNMAVGLFAALNFYFLGAVAFIDRWPSPFIITKDTEKRTLRKVYLKWKNIVLSKFCQKVYYVLITARAAVHRYGIYIMLSTMSFPQVLSEVEKKIVSSSCSRSRVSHRSTTWLCIIILLGSIGYCDLWWSTFKHFQWANEQYN